MFFGNPQAGTEGLKEFGPATVTLARAEGLEAHALSVEMRFEKINSGEGVLLSIITFILQEWHYHG
jgi:hypothetical protein